MPTNKASYSDRAAAFRRLAIKAEQQGVPHWAAHCRARAIQLEKLAKLSKLGQVVGQ